VNAMKINTLNLKKLEKDRYIFLLSLDLLLNPDIENFMFYYIINY
jgi:hypothetical protein